MISGLATTYASMPVDIAKTRYSTYFAHMSNFKPVTVVKNSSSTIVPPTEIQPRPLRCRGNALTTKLREGGGVVDKTKRSLWVFTGLSNLELTLPVSVVQ